MKCKVCGKRFKLQADKRYEVLKKPDGFAGVLSGKATICYECFDCLRCGCQNAVNVREINLYGEKSNGQVKGTKNK